MCSRNWIALDTLKYRQGTTTCRYLSYWMGQLMWRDYRRNLKNKKPNDKETYSM